jgi:hypothetical protein
MLNIIKLLIPTGQTKEISELESWTVAWEVKTGWTDATKKMQKVFIKKDEAKEFEENLKNSANFIGAWIRTDFYKN